MSRFEMFTITLALVCAALAIMVLALAVSLWGVQAFAIDGAW